MQVCEPFYQFCSQIGKYKLLYAAFATWLLGFATWHIMYYFGRTAEAQPIPASLPGPASFVSVWIGDGVALPVMNALIVLFYYKVSNIKGEMLGGLLSKPLVVGGRIQTSIAVFIAALATVGTYISWFTVNKVDWSIPHPGELNVAGVYHAIFLGTEIYFISTFAISVVRIFLAFSKPALDQEKMFVFQKQLAHPLLFLVRIFVASSLVGEVFAAALLVDVWRGLIPLSSYVNTAIFVCLPSVIVTSLLLFGTYRKSLTIFLRDIWVPLLLLTVLAGGVVLLWEI